MASEGPLNPRWAALECFACGASVDHRRLATVCAACGKPLAVRYALGDPPGADAPRRAARDIPAAAASMWRYHQVLPVLPEHAVTLGEGWTPLLPADRARGALAGGALWVKDEAQNPTGSFKARGMSAAVSVAKALGARGLRAPSAGNAASALAAYGAAAGLPVAVALPVDTPRAFADECRLFGAVVELVGRDLAEAGAWLREHGPRDWFDLSTLREPHRVEGKKTMGYELWEQLGGTLPDVVVYPTGGGTGLIGMWKAWSELRALGWLDAAAALPRMVCVQAEGCAPIVRAWRAGAAHTEPWADPQTRAWGLRVPSPLGGFVCLRALRETGGTAIAVAESEIERGTRELAGATGIDVCPEGGAAFAAYLRLRAQGFIRQKDKTVLFNTGTGLKYR